MMGDAETRHQPLDKSRKVCFVTIGATASFDRLLKAVLDTPFLQALKTANFTNLLIQYGKARGKAIYDAFMANEYEKVQQDFSIEIAGFDFNPEGLMEEMRQAKGDIKEGSQGGVMISHAGSGSILEALRIGVPLVVVPNTDLLHNHQIELAEELAKQEYVVHGSLNHLSSSIPEAEELRQRQKQWPPPNDGEVSGDHGLVRVIDEEMGWVD